MYHRQKNTKHNIQNANIDVPNNFSINIPKNCFFSVHQYWGNDTKQRQELTPPPLHFRADTSASEEGIAGVALALAALNYSEFNSCVTVLPPLAL